MIRRWLEHSWVGDVTLPAWYSTVLHIIAGSWIVLVIERLV